MLDNIQTQAVNPVNSVNNTPGHLGAGKKSTDRKYSIPALFPLLLISILSLTLSLVIYSWQSAKENSRDTQVFGQSAVSAISRISERDLNKALQANSVDLIAPELAEHPSFLYLIVETVYGEKLLASQKNQTADLVPDLPLSVNQRRESGFRDFITNESTYNLTEFYAPFENSTGKVLRIGFMKPVFYWPSGAFFYLLISMPLVLLTLASLSTLFNMYVPIRALSKHCKKLSDSKELKAIEKGNFNSPLFDSFNEVIDNAIAMISETEVNQDTLQLDRKILIFERLRSESIINNLPSGVIALDCSGLIIYANDKISRFLPSDENNCIGKLYSDWCPSDVVTQFIKRHQKNPTRKIDSLQFCYMDGGNSKKIASVNALPILSNQSNEPLGSIYVFNDITADIHHKRMSDDFIINVAHELKTPLHVLKMYSETLIDNDLDENLLIESVNTIYDEVDRMALLVNNLLNIAKFDMGDLTADRQRIKLTEFLNDVHQNMSHKAQQVGVHLEKNIPSKIGVIVADKELLRVAINNLLSNAIKYSGPDGEVILAAEESDQHIVISVSDNGPGVQEKDIGRIFDKFYRVDNAETKNVNGHGLGLTLAKKIVQMHHGKISVQSTPGSGSKFDIVLTKKHNLMEKAS